MDEVQRSVDPKDVDISIMSGIPEGSPEAWPTREWAERMVTDQCDRFVREVGSRSEGAGRSIRIERQPGSCYSFRAMLASGAHHRGMPGATSRQINEIWRCYGGGGSISNSDSISNSRRQIHSASEAGKNDTASSAADKRTVHSE